MKGRFVFPRVAVVVLILLLLVGCTPSNVTEPPASDGWELLSYPVTPTLYQTDLEADGGAYCYSGENLYYIVKYIVPMGQLAQRIEVHCSGGDGADRLIYQYDGEGLWANEICTNGEYVAFAKQENGTYSVEVYDIQNEQWSVAVPAQGLTYNPLLAMGQQHLFWYGESAVLCTYRLADGVYAEYAADASGRVAVYQDQVVYQSAARTLTLRNMSSGAEKQYTLPIDTQVFDLDCDGKSILWSTAEKPRNFYLIDVDSAQTRQLELPQEYRNKSFFKAYCLADGWVSINTNAEIYLINTVSGAFTPLYQDLNISLAQRHQNKLFFVGRAQDGTRTHYYLQAKG